MTNAATPVFYSENYYKCPYILYDIPTYLHPPDAAVSPSTNVAAA